MLSQLTIKNFGLIDNLTLDFDKGLNIFTGETGAGKSILIDALRYALGDKLDKNKIRDEKSECTVEAILDLSDDFLKIYPFIKEYVNEEGTIIIRRTTSREGKTRNKLNDFTITGSELEKIGNYLIDFHGPNDHQLLFSEDSHLSILDTLSKMSPLIEKYSKIYSEYTSLTKKHTDLKELSAKSDRELDILSYQVKDLEQVSLDKNKYDALLKNINMINNSEKLYEDAIKLQDVLSDENYGLTSSVSKAFRPLEKLSQIDTSVAGLLEMLEEIQDKALSLSNLANDYVENLSFNPKEADELNRTYDIYYDLLRKYGPDIEAVNDFYKKAKDKYELLINIEHNDSELRRKINFSEKELLAVAKLITEKRKITAKSLKKTIEKELKDLGIPHVNFECRVNKGDISPHGTDSVTFLISPNAGEELKPLAKIVSSGEAARIMLALKKALTKVDPVPILIFDEIDSQIGGRLGTITGEKLKELSIDRQVILITHLPQIASFSDTHFTVYKKVLSGRTATTVVKLSGDAKLQELAKMMSGDNETEISLSHAKEMLEKSKH